MRWYYGWNVLAVTVLFQAILFGFTISSFTLFIPEWINEFHADISDLQLAILIYTAVQCLVAPLPGLIVDRTSIRNMLTIGAIMTIAGIALLSLVTAVWQIVAIYSCLISVGVLLAGTLPSQTLAVKWFRGRRGFAIGASTMGVSLGGTVMPMLVTKLFLAVGWREAHLILAAIALVLVLPAIWAVIRNSPEEMGIEPDPETEISAARTAARVFPEWTILGILRERTFWIMICSFVPMAMAVAAVQHNIRPIAQDAEVNAMEAAFLVSVFFASAMGSKILFGIVADRVDLRRLFWIANGCLFASILLLALQPNYEVMLGAAVLLGVGSGGFLPLLGSVISTRFGPRSFGRVMSLVGPFTMLTGVGPYLAGQIRDHTGHYVMALHIFLVILVPAVLAMALLKPLAALAPRNLAPGE